MYCLFPRTAGLFASLNVQKSMLQDGVRVSKFREAVRRTVRAGDTVLDLGTGTGILALWAAEAGAGKVIALEETSVAELARAVVRANGLESVVKVVGANSTCVDLAEKADVLIAELVGHFVFEEGIVEYVSDARKRLLKPTARLIPSSASVHLSPVALGREFTEVSYWDTWDSPVLSPLRKWAANTAYVETIRPDQILAQPQEVFKVDFSTARPSLLSRELAFRIERDGGLDALGGWFSLHLAEGVALSTSPWDPPTHWQQCIFPLDNPLPVTRGEALACTISIEPRGPEALWRWQVSMSRDGNQHEETHEFLVRFDQSFRMMRERF